MRSQRAIYFLSDQKLLFQMQNKCRTKNAEQMQNKCRTYQGPIESFFSLILIDSRIRSLLKMMIIRAKTYFTKGWRDGLCVDSLDSLRYNSDVVIWKVVSNARSFFLISLHFACSWDFSSQEIIIRHRIKKGGREENKGGGRWILNNIYWLKTTHHFAWYQWLNR